MDIYHLDSTQYGRDHFCNAIKDHLLARVSYTSGRKTTTYYTPNGIPVFKKTWSGEVLFLEDIYHILNIPEYLGESLMRFVIVQMLGISLEIEDFDDQRAAFNLIKQNHNLKTVLKFIRTYNTINNQSELRLTVTNIKDQLNTDGYPMTHFCLREMPNEDKKFICFKNVSATELATLINTNYATKAAEYSAPIPANELPLAHDESPCEILGYNTRVEQVLPVDVNSSSTRFGIELELENATDSNIRIVHKHLKKHAIMKRDGSLRNGVEIVSIPSSVLEHKKQYKPFFEDEHTLKAESNCGIHIHVTREKMSFLALGRILKFLAKNKEHIYKIAGRKSDNYAAIKSDWNITSPWYAVNDADKYRKNPKFNWAKYTGLNLVPGRTMEFRIFKSTTKYEEFCRFLEFTEAIIDYCTLSGNDNNGKIRKIEDMFAFSNFSDYVVARGSAYPELAKFIRKECV